MSLRLRLVLGVIGLAAIAVIAFAVSSYRSLDSYLDERVDEQLRGAIEPIAHTLLARAQIEPAGVGAVGGPGQGAALAPPAGEPGPPPPAQLPPGTYGQLRDSSGEVVGQVLFGYGEQGFERPDLSSLEAAHAPGELHPRTVSAAAGGGSTDFRVAAVSTGAGTIAVAIPLTETQSTLDRLVRTEVIVALIVLAALAALAWWMIRLGLRPLERMGQTADEIAAGDYSRRVESQDSRTEVGRLGLALNRMLEELQSAIAQREASEQRMRRFLADASHELRTPLASIRGYSELFRLGATESPEDLEKALGRIEQESERMGVLVDDLLTLARLDQVREPVRERVDLVALGERECEDARAAAPRREIAFGGDGPVEVVGDPEQLRRALANLLRNAIVHTPAEAPIEVGVEADDGEARISVRDHGPGLDGEGDRIFERFWRGDSARGRDSGGSGLGLAIVAAVAGAHDGAAHAQNAEGGGALFTIVLPLAGRP